MTVKNYFKNGGKWDIQCDTSVPYRAMTVNIGFLNNNKIDDEVQFDIQAYNVDELNELFHDFCKENDFHSPIITYISIIKTAETMEILVA